MLIRGLILEECDSGGPEYILIKLPHGNVRLNTGSLHTVEATGKIMSFSVPYPKPPDLL